MPILDHESHAAREDLHVLRDVLGPAKGGPRHADAMRAAAAEARRRRRVERDASPRRLRDPAHQPVEG
ncbi:hypothetical protein [Salinarimonas rosea]|uniref:hypothetical protein n=1 Tax=Salinarimonas rosea TaxID=552063 RepID=UPI0004090468|nr:hypothetical protein [Salinarimonas rosea]